MRLGGLVTAKSPSYDLFGEVRTHEATRPTRATHYDADTTMKRTEHMTNIAPWSVIMRNSAAKQLY